MYYTHPYRSQRRQDLDNALWVYLWGDKEYAIELMSFIVEEEITEDHVQEKQASQAQRKAAKSG